MFANVILGWPGSRLSQESRAGAMAIQRGKRRRGSWVALESHGALPSFLVPEVNSYLHPWTRYHGGNRFSLGQRTLFKG